MPKFLQSEAHKLVAATYPNHKGLLEYPVPKHHSQYWAKWLSSGIEKPVVNFISKNIFLYPQICIFT
jgi:hypothetical protein